MKKSIYDLELNEGIMIKFPIKGNGITSDFSLDTYVIRVPGGWLFSKNSKILPPVFVPFNNEFQDIL